MSLCILTVASIFCAGLYSYLLFVIFRLGKVSTLKNHKSVNLPPSAKGTAVIAVRNEAANIRSCINMLSSQSGIEHVIIVDDHSDDETLSLANEDSQKTQNIQVLTAPCLPEGWTGKNHALNYGSEFVKTKYIIFSDADVIIQPDTIMYALNYMEIHDLDLLSGHFRIKCSTSIEKICAPVLAVSSVISLFVSARSSGSAMGAFIILKTAFYRHIGCHSLIRNSIVDDVALARLAKEKGARTAFMDLSENISVRLFKGIDGFRQLVSRTSQPYLQNKLAFCILGGLVVAATGLFTIINLITAIVFVINNTNDFRYLLFIFTALPAYLLGFMVVISSHRYYNTPGYWTLFYPVGIILLGLASAYSGLMKVLKRNTVWRGRAYQPA